MNSETYVFKLLDHEIVFFSLKPNKQNTASLCQLCLDKASMVWLMELSDLCSFLLLNHWRLQVLCYNNSIAFEVNYVLQVLCSNDNIASEVDKVN